MSLRAFAWLRRLVGLFPRPKAQIPSGKQPRKLTLAEQEFIAALDDVAEKLQDFTRIMQARARRQREQVTTVTPQSVLPVIKAPPWLVERMAAIRNLARPTLTEVEKQMLASAKLSRMMDRGMTQEEAKQFALDHSNDVLAHLDAPWREKIGDNRYKGSCGCVFDAAGNRVEWCGDHY